MFGSRVLNGNLKLPAVPLVKGVERFTFFGGEVAKQKLWNVVMLAFVHGLQWKIPFPEAMHCVIRFNRPLFLQTNNLLAMIGPGCSGR